MDETMLQQIKETLVLALPDLQAVYLFGSCAKGEEISGSDIDLAFLAQNLVPVKQCWDIAQQLAVSLGRDVDLIDLRQASTVMQKEIVATGLRMICQDSVVVENFETYVFSAYAHLNEERRAILEDIRNRGSVYG